jgi:hypothetical protein
MDESPQTSPDPVSSDFSSTGSHAAGGACCESCARHQQKFDEQFVYALGRLEVRFPTVGVQREFRQRELAERPGTNQDSAAVPTRGDRLHAVLSRNLHLARRVCWVHMVGRIPAYIVVPSSLDVLQGMLSAIQNSQTDRMDLVVGRRVGNASPTTCGGLLAPIVACDQLYSFGLDEWSKSLAAQSEPLLRSRNIAVDTFTAHSRELLERIAMSTENTGGLDTHRALNYLVVQHPGFFAAAAERSANQILDRIETRPIQGSDFRRVVAVILTFVERTTGVAERLFCRIDVTEEWPFLADGPEGPATRLGMQPFIENTILGQSF